MLFVLAPVYRRPESFNRMKTVLRAPIAVPSVISSTNGVKVTLWGMVTAAPMQVMRKMAQ